MFIKKGISFTPEQVQMQIFEVGDAQNCINCGKALDPASFKNGEVLCICGQTNEMNLENTNGK
jgi:methionyl-tRNA synthetase